MVPGEIRALRCSGGEVGASVVQGGAYLSSLYDAEWHEVSGGVPCSPPPWGLISAVDLDTGKLAWRKPLGTTSSQAPFGIALNWGTPNFGGPLMTAGGLAFVAGWACLAATGWKLLA